MGPFISISLRANREATFVLVSFNYARSDRVYLYIFDTGITSRLRAIDHINPYFILQKTRRLVMSVVSS